MGCVLEESGTDGADCSRRVVSERRGAGAIRFLVNARDLQLEYARVFLPETLIIPVFTYDSETMSWREIRAVQMGRMQ